LKMLFACFLCAYLMFDPEMCIARAQEAMLLWARCVAPGIFPFLVLLPFFTSAEAQWVYEKLFGRLFSRIFRLGSGAVPCVVCGLIGGSPAGAISIRKAYRAGKTDSHEALTALTLASGLSPVFLVCGVGQGMFSDALTGVKILICSIVSGGISAFIASRLPIKGRKIKCAFENRQAEETGAVASGVNAALSVCGWMVLFSVYSGRLPEIAGVWCEVSQGCAYAAQTGNRPLACAAACFSGACVLMQNAACLISAGGEVFLFFTLKCVQCALGTGMFLLLDGAWKGQTVFSADAFTVSAGIAVGLVVVISIIFSKELKKNVWH